MAVATQAAGGRESVRLKRERDQELLVWPDLVFIEFIAAVIFTISFVVLSTLVNAPLLNQANSNITPNPSKAPWYFMNLQELLLHMDKGLAGVLVPTALLVGLMSIPYVDRDNDGQGGWFATPNALRIAGFSFVYSGVWITWLILWDNSSHVNVYQRLPLLWGSHERLQWLGDKHPFTNWPGAGFFQAIWDFVFLRNRLSIRDTWHWSIPVPYQPGAGHHSGYLTWPTSFQQVPLPLNGTWLWYWRRPGWMPGWMLHVYWYNSDVNIPAITAEWVVPIATMIGLPALMIFILRKLGWATTMRDTMIALFTGFITVYVALTIVGVAFRGAGQQLVLPTSVPNLEKDPHIMRQTLPGDHYGLYDPGSGGVNA
jgi:quinol---cytochrome c reductase cytochrome c subunit, bacillus type